MSPWKDELSELMNTIHEQQDRLNDYQAKLDEMSITTRSTDKTVEVTVDPKGGVTKIEFRNKKYRSMSGNSLGEVLVTTIKKAQSDLQNQIAEQLPDSPLDGVSTEDVLSGDVDLSKMFDVEKMIKDVSNDLFGTSP